MRGHAKTDSMPSTSGSASASPKRSRRTFREWRKTVRPVTNEVLSLFAVGLTALFVAVVLNVVSTASARVDAIEATAQALAQADYAECLIEQGRIVDARNNTRLTQAEEYADDKLDAQEQRDILIRYYGDGAIPGATALYEAKVARLDRRFDQLQERYPILVLEDLQRTKCANPKEGQS